MGIGVRDIYNLIKVCQDFDTRFDGDETVELFAKTLDISKISYRIFFNDVSIESAVIYHSDNSSSGEEFDFKRVASNDRVIMLKIIRKAGSEPLDSDGSFL